MTATGNPPAGDSSDGDRPPSPPVEPLPIPFYLLVEPMVSGKRVLDVTTRVGGPGPECLRRAGAAEVISCTPTGPSLPAADAGVDIVLCGLSVPVVRSDAERAVWLAEIRRVLQPGGFCVLRLAAAAFREDAQAGVRAACTDLLLGYLRDGRHRRGDAVRRRVVPCARRGRSGGERILDPAVGRLWPPGCLVRRFCGASVEPDRESPGPDRRGRLRRGSAGRRLGGELAAWQGEVARLESAARSLVASARTRARRP
jgi:hypothetical protein